MRMTLRYLLLLLAARATAAIAAAPCAVAQSTDSSLPSCVDTGGSAAPGGGR